MIDVVLAEDHTLVRQGIRALLDKADDINVVGEAENGHEAIRLVCELVPDVLLMDITMPRLNGIDATGQVCDLRLGTQVLILSMHKDEAMVRQALQHGARGYLLKNSVTEELLVAIRAVSQGRIYLSPDITGPVVRKYLATSGEPEELSPLDRLTPREREVLQLIAEGNTSAQMAEKMVVSVKTVGKHRRSLMKKLDARDVAKLTRIAIKYDVISVDD